MNRKTIGLLVIGLLVLAVAMMSGCIKEEKPSEPSAPTKTPTQKQNYRWVNLQYLMV